MLKILGIVLVLLVVLLIAGAVWVNHYLQSPEFKQFALGAARKAVGTEIKVSDFSVSPFSGVSLKGVAIANPEGFSNQLLTADAFVLRYRLLPLLRRQVVIDELSLQKPNIQLMRGDKGRWNYEPLTEQPTPAGTSSEAPKPKPETSPTPSSTTRGSYDLLLSKLTMTDGNLVMVNEKNQELLKVQNINLSSSVDWTGGRLSGSGKASIELLDVANSLMLRQVASPLRFSTNEIALASLSGKLAGGTISGNITVNVLDGLKYVVNLQVKDSDVDTLLQEAHTKRVVNGKLQATTALTGTSGLPTIVGNGHAEVVGGKLSDIPLLNQLSLLLQVPALKDLKFEECRLEFSLSNNVMQTPVIRLISPQVQITGTGSVNLADYTLNHDMTLALAESTLAIIPPQIRAIFHRRADGFLTVDFRVWGPYDSPKTDLPKRLVKGAAEQFLKSEFQKLIK